jgi:hypothetical protein
MLPHSSYRGLCFRKANYGTALNAFEKGANPLPASDASSKNAFLTYNVKRKQCNSLHLTSRSIYQDLHFIYVASSALLIKNLHIPADARDTPTFTTYIETGFAFPQFIAATVTQSYLTVCQSALKHDFNQ